jgi:hypothetical protein
MPGSSARRSSRGRRGPSTEGSGEAVAFAKADTPPHPHSAWEKAIWSPWSESEVHPAVSSHQSVAPADGAIIIESDDDYFQ